MWTRPVAAFAALLAIAGMPVAAVAAPNDAELTLVAGTGAAGSSGDGGPAVDATLNTPFGAAVGPDGTLFISDTGNHKVRAVAPDGTIRTVAGSGKEGTRFERVSSGAKATDVALMLPADLAISPDGTLYLADAGALRVYALAKDGSITVRASAETIDASNEPLGSKIGGLAAGTDGIVYLGDPDNNRVLAIAPDGTATVAAGNGVLTVSAAGGPATQIPVGPPNALAADTTGDLWISGGLLLRRLRGGTLATVTESADGKWALADGSQWPPADPPLNNVEKVSAGSDGPYVFDRQAKAVFRLAPGGAVTTVATLTGSTFGDLGQVQLAAGAAPKGPIYLVDTGHHRVFAASVPATGGRTPPAEGTTRWPYMAGGAVLLVLVFVGVVVLVRRRRIGTS